MSKRKTLTPELKQKYIQVVEDRLDAHYKKAWTFIHENKLICYLNNPRHNPDYKSGVWCYARDDWEADGYSEPREDSK